MTQLESFLFELSFGDIKKICGSTPLLGTRELTNKITVIW